MNSIIVIPARLESKRLPGKPLIDIMGKSMIERTYEKCRIGAPDIETYVATDHQLIFDHCTSKGMNVIMTSKSCLTGTDRVAEVAEKIDADYYINVQGDEPVLDPEDLKTVVKQLKNATDEVYNCFTAITENEMYYSRTIPKVVVDKNNSLLYMSRAPIPGSKDDKFLKAWRQICIYAFPYKSLMDFKAAGEKTPLEAIEDIEILRFLEMGHSVKMIKVSGNSLAVDTEEDLAKVKQLLSQDV